MHTARISFFLAPLALAAACGSRTGVLLPTEGAGHETPDGGEDGEPDATEPLDATEPFDVREDLPGIDVVVPMDALNDCPDAGSTFIYVISQQNVLLSFYPPTASFTSIGTISCPGEEGDTPFSMAVDRQGVAYVVFYDTGNIYRVSTLTAACEPTAYEPTHPQFPLFGMGFSQDLTDPNETLYLSGDPGFREGASSPAVLGSLNTTTFGVTTIGTIAPTLVAPELTGTGAGQLFGFYATGDTSSAIAEIDRTTAKVVAVSELPGVPQGGGWAFGFWGGDFYMFTAPGGTGASSIVTRYRPSDGSITRVATTPGLTIVGAGVSTCAPQQ